MNFFEQFSRSGLLAAHRGFRFHYPENTLCAFAAAVGRCDFLETDIRLSRDQVPVVLHDATLERTSNAATLAGRSTPSSLAVRDWSLAELRRLDMGSWFLDADPFAAIASGTIQVEELRPLMPQTIMTLDELLAWSEKNALPLNIELKDLTETGGREPLPEIVLESIRQAGAGNRVVLSSFNHDYLRRINTLAPDLTTAALQKAAHPPDLIPYLRSLGVSAYQPNKRIIDTVDIAALAAANIIVNVFTVNDPKEQQELYARGVLAVFADMLYRSRTGE